MPLFSILTPVFDTPRAVLEKTIHSVLEQNYEDWEWCIVDDASTYPHITESLTQLAERDSRIRVVTRDVNGGITQASQDALEMASGEFIVLLDHDDTLRSDALETIAEILESNETIDYLYSDEDKIDLNDHHYDEFLKPDWSPERLRGQNYCCHVSVFRRSLVEEVGGFRLGFDGAQDYDLILRVTEKARTIHHIPEVLYHWRAVTGSTAASIDEKPDAYTAAQLVLQDHLDRLGINGTVIDAGFGYHQVVRTLNHKPLISIIIPTCGSRAVIAGVDTCLIHNVLRSINDQTTYRNFEIVIVADTHTPPYVMQDLNQYYGGPMRIVSYDKPFNFSDKCNVGFTNSVGDLVLLLNDDVQIITPDWLETLASLALEPEVGLVGPMLLFESGLIQSAGHSNTHLPHNFHLGTRYGEPGQFGFLAVAREVSGLTGAAMMCRRNVFEEVGGLSVTFPNCFNDVDFCFKILNHEYRIIWTPFARLYHFESVSRNPEVNPRELKLLSGRWGRFFDDDRFCRYY